MWESMNDYISMRLLPVAAILVLIANTLACSNSNEGTKMPQPPIAETRHHLQTYHDIELSDPYFWLKDHSYPEVDDEDVLNYLLKENEYFDAFMSPISSLVDKIQAELKGRLKQDDSTVPTKDGDYIYQSTYSEGSQYRVHLRWLAATATGGLLPPDEGAAEVLIDENKLAAESDYFRLGGRSISPNDELLAYSTDHDGSERYKLVIRNLTTGKYSSETIANVQGSVVWASDSKSFLYVTQDDKLRPNRVWHHVLGTEVSEDRLVYEESDEGFFVSIGRTTSRKFALIDSSDHVTSEVRFVPLEDLHQEPKLFSERRKEHTYHVDHRQEAFVILSNDTHKNFRLATTGEETYQAEQWDTLLNASDERYITGVQAFDDRIVIAARENGLDQILISSNEGSFQPIGFDEAAYSAGFHYSPEANPTHLRITYSSLTTPRVVFDYEFESGNRITRKTQEIPSGYQQELYTSERRMATSHDGVKVPVSIAYRKDTPLDGSAPLYLTGYGAYGSSSDPYFSTNVLSLLDRGFIFAIAHIRGGSEMGYHWYEEGKLDRRMNTFLDFVRVARYLIDQDFTSEGRIAISGGSAGGTLMGVVANEAPNLWGAVIAYVPFVDVLNTMLDTSLPLTPIEWPEWGNPITDKAAFEYIRSYSPYDQISRQDYPPMLVTAGLNDPRVTYWEPAKYVAKLRSLKTDSNPLLLRTQMGAGHSGKSGRYDSLRETAEAYAFMLTTMGISDDAE